MILRMELGSAGYYITIERGALSRAGEIFRPRGKAMVVTDTGVPRVYAEAVAAQFPGAFVACIPEGEPGKSVEVWQNLLEKMLSRGMTRSDCVIAVGGGVVGDLAGFAAATYMRGVDFYNVPTTLLSQVDSSIGGKTAVNFGGVKNVVGAFYQPKAVLVDPDVLRTLPARQISNGLAEAIKVAMTSDAALFSIFESEAPLMRLEEIIRRALEVKRAVVCADEKENGLRRVLNFGHTIGHAIESAAGGRYYHGECVALGMVPMTAPALRPRLKAVLRKFDLPTCADVDENRVAELLRHDKKSEGDGIRAVFVDTPGAFRFEKCGAERLRELLSVVRAADTPENEGTEEEETK